MRRPDGMQWSRGVIAAVFFIAGVLLVLLGVNDPRTVRGVWAALVLVACVGVPYLAACAVARLVAYVRGRRRA